MELPGKLGYLLKEKETKPNLFFAILFEQARLTVAVFSPTKRKAEILGFRHAPYTGKLSDATEIIDHLIVGLSDELPNIEQISKTIFGFPQTFIEDNKIKPDILAHLKQIVTRLSLKPAGFVVISEALAFYVSSKAGAQESAIFVGIHPQEIHVALLKIGQIVEEKTVARTDQLCFDVATALNSFQQDVLPAKIMLYNNAHSLVSVKEEFLHYPWDQKCNFLHFPKIELLPALATLEAIVAAYTEKKAIIVKNEKIAVATQDVKTVKPEELGFSASKQSAAETIPPKLPAALPVGKPAAAAGKQTDKLAHIFRRGKVEFPQLNFSILSGRPRLILFLPVLLLIIVIGGLFARPILTSFLTSRARIQIFVASQQLSQELDFTLDPKINSVDAQTKKIPGTELTVELSAERTTDTTGSKLIGKPATGKVIIYNKTTKTKTFHKDAMLLAANKFKFKLNKAVKVASASVQVEGNKEIKTYGSQEVEVTAAQIGPEGNIEKGAKLVFEQFPQETYTAQASADFSGGTSREVSAVSTDDIDNLRKLLLDDLKKQAQRKIKPPKEENLTVITETLDHKIVAETLSAAAGEQAKAISIQMTVQFAALAFKQEDIATLLQKNAQTEIPEGFIMQSGNSRQKILDKQVNKDGSVSFRSAFTITLLPAIDIEQIRTKAAGMKMKEFEQFLRSQHNIRGFKIVFDKKIPFLSSTVLPSDPAKISVTIVSR